METVLIKKGKNMIINIKNIHEDFIMYSVEADDKRSAVLKLIESGADLSGADLKGINLEGIDLRNIVFEGADLRGANFKGASFYRTNLKDAFLENADFRHSNLKGANLSGSDCRGAKFNGADLSYSDLHGAHFRGADFRGANMDFANWSFSCKSLQAIVDDKLRIQMLYHAAKPTGDIVDEDLKELLESELFKRVANKFHWVQKCGIC